MNMSLWSDWGFWAFVMATIAGLFNWFSHVKITTNDLHHVEVDLKSIHTNLAEQDIKLDNLAVSMAYIKGKIETESKVMEVLEKVLTKATKEKY